MPLKSTVLWVELLVQGCSVFEQRLEQLSLVRPSVIKLTESFSQNIETGAVLL